MRRILVKTNVNAKIQQCRMSTYAFLLLSKRLELLQSKNVLLHEKSEYFIQREGGGKLYCALITINC